MFYVHSIYLYAVCISVFESIRVYFYFRFTSELLHFYTYSLIACSVMNTFLYLHHLCACTCSDEYVLLRKSLERFDPASMRHLLKLKTQLKKDVFTEERIFQSIVESPAAVKLLYRHFSQRHSLGIPYIYIISTK